MNNVYNHLWRKGVGVRNPNYNGHYASLKRSESFSLDMLQKLQFSHTRESLIFAFLNSRFYHEKFSEHSFDPRQDFRCIEDLNRVPIITKQELIEQNALIHSGKSFGRLFLSETSGSTGQSLTFRKDGNWDSFNRASRARGFSWYDVKPWDRNGYLWGYNFSGSAKIMTSVLDTLQNRFRIFSYKDDAVIRFAHKLKNADYICGYSSMIYEVAKRINEIQGTPKPLNLKMVCGTSEKIYESYQNQSIKAFGRKIIGEYGAAEAGVIAFECPHGSLHINMEGVLVEEENGEIIVTNLVARSFPVIRYKLGDYIKLRDPAYECPCGMKHRVIEDVLGRVGKVIYGRNGKYPSLTFYYVFKNLAVNNNIELNYQAEQYSKGEIVLKLQQQLPPLWRASLDKELLKYFGGDIEFRVEDGQTIHKMQGKFRDFVSYID